MNKQEINKILNNWNVGDLISYKKADKGVVNHNYIVKTSKGEFVLRKVAPYKKLSDLRFEIKYLTYLKKHKFSYRIPAPILTKNKKYFLRLNKSYFWMYKFIEGNQVNSFGKPELKEIAKMMAENHNLIEKSKLNNYKGKGNVFAREPVLKELNEFKSEILKKKRPDKKDKIFLREIKILIPLLKSLDTKEYSKLKSYPIHRDINHENTLWKNKKLIGVIDYETVTEINEPFLKDIAVMLQYSCRDKKHNYKLNLKLANFFIKEYRKHRKLSDEEVKLTCLLWKWRVRIKTLVLEKKT